MSLVTREVAWGDALVVETFKTPGGLKGMVDVIRAEVGPHIGTRNTFGKLYYVEGPDVLSERDRFRAWLLIAAAGKEPSDWGIDDSVVPATINGQSLKEALALKCAIRDSNPEPAD